MDHKVKKAATQISQVPSWALCIPNSCPLNSRNGIAINCAVVFSFPTRCTATLREAPTWAIHSLSAEMVISRPIITKATQNLILERQ